MNWSAALVARVPAGVVTVTSTVPVPAGDVAVMVVELTTVTPVAALGPKSTAVAPGEAGAGDGHAGLAGGRPRGRADPVTVGGGGGVGELVGRRGGRGAGRGGDGDVDGAGAGRGGGRDLVVELTTVTPVAALGPKSTAVAPVKPVPVMVTLVPPAAGARGGADPVTVAAAAV